MFKCGWRVCGAVSLLLCVRAVALAGEPQQGSAVPSAALLKAGAQAAKAGHWDACITAYSAAAASDDAPATSGELGMCEERAGKFADAYRHLHRALEGAPSPPKGEPWSRYQAAISRVSKRVALVYLTSNPTNARMVLDGRPIGVADGRGIAVDPGPHTVAAHLDGYEDAVEPRTVSAGDMPNIHLELKPTPRATPPVETGPNAKVAVLRDGVSPFPGFDCLKGWKTPGGAVTSAPVAPPPAPVAWYVPGWSPRGVLVPVAVAGFGAAVFSAGTGLGLEVDRASMRSKVGRSDCDLAARSRPEICEALRERTEQRNIALGVSIGSFAATGLLLGASRLAFAFERGPKSPRVVPTVGSSGGGIVLLGTW
jgi:hypothetical protein